MGNSDRGCHDKVTREEFTRQSRAMQEAKIFTDAEVIGRISAAVLRNGGKIRVLDVGCGPGILSVALASLVEEVVGLDLTPEMIVQAKMRSEELNLKNIRFEVGRVEELLFFDGYFDVVVTRLMLHHLLSPTKAMEEMARVIKKGGLLVLADIVTSEKRAEAELHNALEILRDPSHIRALPESELDRLLNSGGLKAIAKGGWVDEREFVEWIKITNAPERVKPLLVVMRALTEAGVTAGINLRIDGDEVKFDHKWILITAEKIS
jgi:2-polyprenyl-3-methyl-5-hydroxy-6-metoxy-1,4-benzoquinol methylase